MDEYIKMELHIFGSTDFGLFEETSALVNIIFFGKTIFRNIKPSLLVNL